MTCAHVSVKFPHELDAENERFLEETGIYTNKSGFIKEACRAHLRDLNNDTAIAALRLEQLLAQAEQDRRSDNEIEAELEALGVKVEGSRSMMAHVQESLRHDNNGGGSYPAVSG